MRCIHKCWELMDTIARQLMIILKGCGNQERCLRAGRREMSLMSSKKGKGSTRQSASPQSLQMWWSTLFWSHLYPHGWQECDQGTQHEFIKSKSCLTNPVAFHDDKPHGWGQSSGCCLPGLQQGFQLCLSQHPHRQAQQVWLVRWPENWLSSRAQRAAISATGSSWR